MAVMLKAMGDDAIRKDAHILYIDMPDTKTKTAINADTGLPDQGVAEVLFSYGLPVAAKIYIPSADGESGITTRRLIHHKLGYPGLYPSYQGKHTQSHVNIFFWDTHKPGLEKDRPAYYLTHEEEEYIESICTGYIPPMSTGELRYGKEE